MSIVIYYYNAGCGGVVFVDEDAVVIDAPTGDDCVWKIETETDRILYVMVTLAFLPGPPVRG